MLMNVFKNKKFQFLFSVILLVYISNVRALEHSDDDYEVVDIGVRLKGDNHDSLIADLIAEERDVLNAGHIDGVDLYHFRVRRKRNHRSKRAIDETVEDLKRDERVAFVAVAQSLERKKRDFLNDDEIMERFKEYQQMKSNDRSIMSDVIQTDTNTMTISFDDTLYPKQWYLNNHGQLDTPPHHDINVVPAWLAGYSGKGVTICIVDDGVDHPHPELTDRYQPQLSYDLNDLNDSQHDPLPGTYDNQNNHGTRCAGAASGKNNNEMCGVGVAFESNVAAVRVLDGPVTTLLEARALTLYAVDTHIKSASWGPTDDGTKMESPGAFVNEGLEFGVTQGRYGKGTIYVWASGNGGAANDDCGADGYASHHNVISIGSINHLGQSTYFSEFCPSTMAVSYTGGRHQATGDEQTLSVGVVTADVGEKCTTSFFGTSGAAPIAAGSIALVLEANPELSYRDVMHIIARTARIPNLSETEGWRINGAGFHVNDRFGFGVLDVGQMIALAQNWTNVSPRYECYKEYTGGNRKLDIGETIEIPLHIDTCENVTDIEHVVANISFSFHYRGDVKITLVSPSKTPSELLSYRDKDANSKGIHFFPFMTVHNWGESPIGTWILRMETRQPQNKKSMKSASKNGDTGELIHFGLRIYGSSNIEDEAAGEIPTSNKAFAFAPTQVEINSIYKRELAARESSKIMQKRDYENLIQRKQFRNENQYKAEEDRSIFGLFRRKFNF